MGKFSISKQGIEVELQTLDKYRPIEKTNTDSPPITNFHPDDGKVEYSSKPYDSLGDLADALSKDINSAMNYMHEHRVIALPIGCQPYYKDFASGHIHTSVTDMSKDKWLELRQKLFSSQPLIALLSQNSPMLFSLRAADVRLLLSTWSAFTDYDSTSTSHYQSLAYGQNGSTLEIRIPSSGPLYQLIAVAALIRVILKNDDAPMPVLPTKENWSNVISYGSSSLCTIGIPTGITYDGIKNKSITVKTVDLFKVFYEENLDCFKSELSTVKPVIRKQVEKFYDMVSNGITLSDVVFSIVKSNEPNQAITGLYDIFYNSYNDNDVFNLLPKAESYMPIISKYYTITELKDAMASIKEAPFI